MSRRRRRSDPTPREWAGLAAVVLALVGAVTLLQIGDDRLVSPYLRGLTLAIVATTAILAAFALRPRPHPQITVAQFLAMSPTDFEHATASVLRRYGYRLSVTGGAGDLSADLSGTDPDGVQTVVQCKRYAPGIPVRSPEMQQFIGMAHVHHHALTLIYVTTSDYTDDAARLADQHGVVRLNGHQLEALTVPPRSG